MAPACSRDEHLFTIASRRWRLKEETWFDQPMLWTSMPGESCSIWTIWQGADWQHWGWKVNPETPWRRTSIGFDTADLVLDAVIEPDFKSWSWKDEEELDEAQSLGLLTLDEVASVRDVANRVLRRVLDSEQEQVRAWASWRPDPDWDIPELAPGWETPDLA